MKILVVDDDPQILDALTVGLQLQWPECEVIAARDYLAALSQLERALGRPVPVTRRPIDEISQTTPNEAAPR